MDKEILESIQHVKNISKKKVTAEKIFTHIRKKELEITLDELVETLDTMVKDGVINESGSSKNKTYLIRDESDSSIIVPNTQDDSETLQRPNIVLEETNFEHDKSTEENSATVLTETVLDEINNLKKFQVDVESKLCLLEDAIISGKEQPKDLSDDKTSAFVVNILKDRISSLENQLKSKDTIIDFLTQQLLL